MANYIQEHVAEMLERLQAGKMDRRDFLRYCGLFGLLVGAAEALAACAQTPTPAPTAIPCPTAKPAPTCAPPPACPTAVPAAACPECPECEKAPAGWGMENYPYPSGAAFIEPYEQNCVGCGACEMACSMKHFGVINKDWSRVRVTKFMLPLPKAIQTTCVQCLAEERECEKACPLVPKAITYDAKTRHMIVDAARCAGKACLACVKACEGGAVRFVPEASDVVFVCDMCDVGNTGERKPECVDVCPYGALRIRNNTPADNWRMSMQDKADLVAKRLYPLAKTEMANPGWRTK